MTAAAQQPSQPQVKVNVLNVCSPSAEEKEAIERCTELVQRENPVVDVEHERDDRAPAGPGVLLLSDSDLTTYYYVEPCDTLRIAIANLFRGSSRRSAIPIKPQLADHLGIAESRVSQYLADHCVVRYLQLDDDARYFAHFVIAVLRPALNE